MQVVQDLIRMPSRNMPPGGEELACQEYLARYLAEPALRSTCTSRTRCRAWSSIRPIGRGATIITGPTCTRACRAGAAAARCCSPAISTRWRWVTTSGRIPPFAPEIHDGRLYGLGTIDMKGAMGAMAVMYKAIAEKGLRLKGDLNYECVVDEEEGGVNATIAGRLRYGAVDGALIPEGTDLKIYPAAAAR